MKQENSLTHLEVSGTFTPRALSSDLSGGTGGEALFSALFGSCPEGPGKLGICRIPGLHTHWFDPSASGIARAVEQSVKWGTDVYFHTALHDPAKTNIRGNNDSATMITCLWADIDLAEAKKDNEKHYPPRALAMKILENLPVPPCCLVDSGNGLHGYWFLAEPVDAQGHRSLPQAFQAYLRSQFVDLMTGEAYEMDSTHELSRILRCPDTINNKGNRTVQVLHLDNDRRYEVKELARLCPAVRSLPGNNAQHTEIDLNVDPEAEPPKRKLEELMRNPKFADTWKRNRSDLDQKSQSEYDMSLASQSLRAGWTDQEATNLMVAHRRIHQEEPKLRPDYYKRTIAKARASIDEVTDEELALVEHLNLRHAVVHAGKTLILTEKYDPVFNREVFDLESFQSFKDWYANRLHGDNLVSNIWLKHTHRRQYQGIIFSPGKDIPGYYNLFRGFPVKPHKGDCSLYLSLLKDLICNGKEEHYTFVLKWFAHMFQRPAELPGTALVMRGHQGTGKGTLMKYLGQLVGQHFLELVQMRQVTGNFNAHMKDTLLLHANEALWGGDKSAEGAIKAMITDETSAIEFKGKDIITVKNYKRLVFASNNDWVVPRDMDDRRFFILDVSDAYKEDQVYFAGIHKQMATGGLEALFHHLLNVDLDGFNPRVMPKSQGAGFDMKLRSMKGIMQWLYETLDDGEIPLPYTGDNPISDPWPSIFPKNELHRRYLTWCTDQHIRHPETPASFGKALKKVLSELSESRVVCGGRRKHCYKLPSLEHCRGQFEAACKEGPYIWTPAN